MLFRVVAHRLQMSDHMGGGVDGAHDALFDFSRDLMSLSNREFILE